MEKEIRNACKIAEGTKKVEKKNDNLKWYLERLEKAAKDGHRVSGPALDVKYAKKALDKAEKELERLKK